MEGAGGGTGGGVRVWLDKIMDCIPCVSLVNNCVDLIEKYVWRGSGDSAYQSHIAQKKTWRCVLTAIPLVNIPMGIYFLYHRSQTGVQKATTDAAQKALPKGSQKGSPRALPAIPKRALTTPKTKTGAAPKSQAPTPVLSPAAQKNLNDMASGAIPQERWEDLFKDHGQELITAYFSQTLENRKKTP